MSSSNTHGGNGEKIQQLKKRKKSKRPPPPKVPPPMQFQEEDADLNTMGEREEALNPFTSVERVVSGGSKKKKEQQQQQQQVRGQSDNKTTTTKGVSFDQKAPSFQKRNQDLGGENDVNDGYLFVRYVSMKPKITTWKSLGFLFLEIGLAIAFISGYTMMGKGVHVYDFLNKDAHYDAAWYIGVSCFGVFFLLWLLDADVILRHERKNKNE